MGHHKPNSKVGNIHITSRSLLLFKYVNHFPLTTKQEVIRNVLYTVIICELCMPVWVFFSALYTLYILLCSSQPLAMNQICLFSALPPSATWHPKWRWLPNLAWSTFETLFFCSQSIGQSTQCGQGGECGGGFWRQGLVLGSSPLFPRTPCPFSPFKFMLLV